MKIAIELLKVQVANCREQATTHAREEQDFTQKAANARRLFQDHNKRAAELDAAIAKLGN